LISILNANFLAQTISEINRKYRNWSWGTSYPFHLPGNITSAAIALVYINQHPEYELAGSNRFGQFRKNGQFWVEVLYPQPPLKRRKILHGVWVLVNSYLRIRFDLPSSINYSDINSVSQFGRRTLTTGSLRGSGVLALHSMGMISCWSLIEPRPYIAWYPRRVVVIF